MALGDASAAANLGLSMTLQSTSMTSDDGHSDQEARLIEAEQEERSVSRARRQLHRRIEFVSGTAAHEPEAGATLAELQEQERELSRRRRALHVEIDRLRALLGSGRGSAIDRSPVDS